MTEKEKQSLFNLYKDKIHEIEMLFSAELYLPESYDEAIFDKESGKYLDLETFVRKEISDEEKRANKEERIMARKTMRKHYNELGLGKLPIFSSDIKVHQMLFYFYQNEFIPEINRVKGIKNTKAIDRIM